MIIVSGKPILLLNGSGPDRSHEYYNPGGVLTIQAPLTPIAFKLDENGSNLDRALDVLMSNKGNYLSRDPEFLATLKPFNDALKKGLKELKESGFSVRHIQPLMMELQKLNIQAQDAIDANDAGSFRSIASKVVADAYTAKVIEIQLFISMYQWARMNTDSYLSTLHATVAIMENFGISVPAFSAESTEEMSIEDLVEATLKRNRNTHQFSPDDTGREFSLEEESAKSAAASTFNHRIGNLPGMVEEFQTYFDPMSFGEDYSEDRRRLIFSAQAKIHFLNVLQYIIENSENISFNELVEWGQLRTRGISQR